MTIKILDDKSIKKIAAGEVIERPASVVKEMLENAIDARATSISVEVSRGGLDRIMISDDGTGIKEDEIRLAFERHATSKIQSFDDLYHTYTLGFRGEALASILAVSDVTIRTRTNQSSTGTEVVFNDGIEVKRSSLAMAIGTTMIVENLFNSVPVRRKFLQSERTESNYITQVLYRQAIGNPEISMRYRRDGKTVFVAPKTQNNLENLGALFGKTLTDHLISIDNIKSGIGIKGYLSNNLYYRGNRSMQYLYVNGRYIENREISEAIEAAYKTIIPNGKFPVFFINITIDSEEIDVNVHPNKQAIKFNDFDGLINLISQTVDNTIRSHQKLNTLIDQQDGQKLPTLEDLKTTTDYKSILQAYHPTEDKDNQALEPLYEQKTFDLIRETPPLDLEIHPLEKPFNTFPKDQDKSKPKVGINDGLQWDQMQWTFIGSIFNTYLLFEAENLLYAVDQHAAHERIQYEALLDQFKRSEIVVQPMLAPVIIELTDDQMSIFNQNIDDFSKLGFEFTYFADKAIAVRSIPQLLENKTTADIISHLIDASEKPHDHLSDSWSEHLIMAACKGAVKGGDRLDRKEVDHLMRQLFSTDQPYTCPHGRPTLLKLTRYDLEKIFSRVK